MPTWRQIERPLYGLAGLTLFLLTGSGHGVTDPGLVLPTYGVCLMLMGFSGARYLDSFVQSRKDKEQ